jgi:outer membrane protein assembly factor BamB
MLKRTINLIFLIIFLFAILVNYRAGLSKSIKSVDNHLLYLPYVEFSRAQDPVDSRWYMAGANPQRTSWVSEEVGGQLKPIWYRPIEPYIPLKVQVIGAYGALYISTARGLYVLDADTGNEKWVYPTELPLGHSPTVKNGVVYVGGFDNKIHAIDAFSGIGLWTYEASAGFDTNPLIIGDLLYAGNRDGNFYAISINGPNTGKLAWRYATDGPVHFSAAYQDGIVYFASNDNYAYALDSQTGELMWKSSKLLGAGFHSWWPVIYGDVVVFSGSSGYRTLIPPGDGSGLGELDRDYIFPDHLTLPTGTLVGPRTVDGWVDASKVLQYYEEYPWRRTSFVLDRFTGEEIILDIDGDGSPEYAPMLWFGTNSGNRYPPLVGADGILYQANAYASQPWGFRGQVSGWLFGTQFISTPSSLSFSIANDEPIAYSSGGNIIYWNLCCDRAAGFFDLDLNRSPREWFIFCYNLDELIPGYDLMYHSSDMDAVYGTMNGVYGTHGDQNPPIPYQGMVYMHRGNAIIAFGNTDLPPESLPLIEAVPLEPASSPIDDNYLKSILAEEVLKILDAGHLRPGYGISGNFDRAGRHEAGDNLMDYWHEPSDIIYTLLRAFPYLDGEMRGRASAYLIYELGDYPPYEYVHIGWKDGAPREAFDLPPEVNDAREYYPPQEWNLYEYWRFPPHLFYVLWKYAQEFGGAKELFDLSSSRLEAPPMDEVLVEYPFVNNAYIAGYIGYLELEKMAGYPESADIQTVLNQLINLRISTFSKDSPYIQPSQNKTLNVSRNFIFLVPELGEIMYEGIMPQVQEAVEEYLDVAPYWFVQNFEQTYGEGARQPNYDYWALFQAKAYILKDPPEELIKFIDSPSVKIGDLYYIQNLVTLLEKSIDH